MSERERFDYALAFFLGSFIGCATTALSGAEWWAAPLGAAFGLAWVWAGMLRGRSA